MTPSVQVTLEPSIASVVDDTLATTHGAYLAPARLAALEADARWSVDYVVVRRGGSVVLVVPLWRARSARWPDPLAERAVEDSCAHSTPMDAWVFLGGIGDTPSAVLRDPRLKTDTLGELLAAAAPVVADHVRASDAGLAAPFVSTGERDLLLVLFGADVAEAVVFQEARLAVAGATPEQYLASLRSHARSRVRAEWRALAAGGLSTIVSSWESVLDHGCALIADNNIRHGLPDHPALVRARLESWIDVAGVRELAFEVRRGGQVLALGLGLAWNDILQVYLGGLGDPDPDRHLAYVEATIYAPLRWAYAHRCRQVGLGFFATTPKRLRGACIADVSALTAGSAVW